MNVALDGSPIGQANKKPAAVSLLFRMIMADALVLTLTCRGLTHWRLLLAKPAIPLEDTFSVQLLTARSSSVRKGHLLVSEYIVCPHNKSHNQNVLYSVLCSRCHRTLFKVRWWYHAFFLNLILFAIGFIIGEYKNLWIPGLLIEFLFFIYVCIVFRKTRDNLIHVTWLFTLSLLAAFLMVYGDLGYHVLAVIKAILPYVLIIILFSHYLVYWFDEIGNPFINIIKGFPVLTLGLFLVLLIVDQVNDQSQFLDERIVSIIKSHIHLRWILLGLTAGWLSVYAFIKSLGTELNPQREFLRPTTYVDYWTEETKDDNFWDAITSAIKPVVNITLSIYITITQMLKAILNFTIYLLHLVLLWLGEFLLQCLEVAKETLWLFWRVLKSFLRNVALALGTLFVMHYMLLDIPNVLFNQIHAVEGTVVFFRITVDLGIFVFMSLLLILLLGEFETNQAGDAASSIMVTNVAVGLMTILYAWVASIMLWVVGQWLTESPFNSIGSFPFIVGGGALIIGLVIFIYEKFKQ